MGTNWQNLCHEPQHKYRVFRTQTHYRLCCSIALTDCRTNCLPLILRFVALLYKSCYSESFPVRTGRRRPYCLH